MATVRSSGSKPKRWSQDLEREIEAIEVTELLRASTPPPRPDASGGERDVEYGGPMISREMLSEAGRRLESYSFVPPPPRRRSLPAAWIALVMAVSVASAVCAHALATIRLDGSPRVAPPSVAAVAAPATPATAEEPAALVAEPGTGPASAAPAVVPDAMPATEPELGAATPDIAGRAGHASVAEPIAPARSIPDNPYGLEAEAPAPAAASTAPARPADPIDALIGSALAQPDGSRSSGLVPATNDLPDAGARALPDLPSRTDVSRAMAAVADLVRRCGGDVASRLVVEVRVSGATGRVRDAKTVDGQWSGTAAGACAARAVRLAKLPRFAANDLVVRYPFDI